MRPIRIKDGQKLTSLKPEYRSRIDKETGKRLVYVCEDRFGMGCVIVSAKLTWLADYLSSVAGPMKQDKITVSSLYHILSVKEGEGRTGSWSKGRWRVRQVPLERAPDVFEQLRSSGTYEDAVVVGSERCTLVQPV
jgi:hypothetical protein